MKQLSATDVISQTTYDSPLRYTKLEEARTKKCYGGKYQCTLALPEPLQCKEFSDNKYFSLESLSNSKFSVHETFSARILGRVDFPDSEYSAQ